jgi:prephenate dehydrogenase
MWTELFSENSDNLLPELDNFIMSLTEYRNALRSGDKSALMELLREGKRIKEAVDRGESAVKRRLPET